jgi:hypothetical protein
LNGLVLLPILLQGLIEINGRIRNILAGRNDRQELLLIVGGHHRLVWPELSIRLCLRVCCVGASQGQESCTGDKYLSVIEEGDRETDGADLLELFHTVS